MPDAQDPTTAKASWTQTDQDRLTAAVETAAAYRHLFADAETSPGSGRDLEVLIVIAATGEATAAEIARRLNRDRPAVGRSLSTLRRHRLVADAGRIGRQRPHRLTTGGREAISRFLARS